VAVSRRRGSLRAGSTAIGRRSFHEDPVAFIADARLLDLTAKLTARRGEQRNENRSCRRSRSVKGKFLKRARASRSRSIRVLESACTTGAGRSANEADISPGQTMVRALTSGSARVQTGAGAARSARRPARETRSETQPADLQALRPIEPG
jgi:hypothetical protein